MKNVVVLLLAAFASTGCVTAPHMNTSPSPVDKVLDPKDGIVVVSVTGNTSQVNQFDSIQVVPVQKETSSNSSDTAAKPLKQIYTLTQSSRGLARDTAVFAGVLPEGEYHFERFSDDDTHQYVALSEEMKKSLGTFTVSAGTLSDLGRIVITPANYYLVTIGRSAKVTSNEPLVKRFLPDLYKSYSASKTITGWTGPKDPMDISEESGLIHPVGATALTELPNGEVAAATRMGTVLLRDRNGDWRRVTSGRLESLLWIAPYEEGDSRLLAAGEFNTLFRMDRNEHLHAVDTGDLPPGNLFFITGNNVAGFFIAQTRGNDVFIYRSSALVNPKWEQIRQEKIGMSFWSGMQSFWAWPTSKGFAYATSKGGIHIYDYAAKSWTHRKAPNERSLSVVNAYPGDIWGIMTSPGGGFGGVFAKTHYTRDFGETWIETNSPYSVKVSAPKITPKGTIIETGGVFGKTGIQASHDNGKTWRQVTEKPVLADSFWVMPTAGLFLITDGRMGVETIEQSSDEGATWRVERTTFNRELYKQQKKK